MATRKLGKYEVIERLGRGGMAEVYRAYHPSLDRFVAIKVLHAFLADDPEFKSRFEKEARNIARLKHPHIVGVYDFENDAASESYFMVMELIEGPTLKDQLFQLSERGERLPLKESIHIIKEAATALAYAHNQGMIHRDVKPANLMMDRDNRVVLTDFGIAKIVTGAQFTASGGMVGTPAYMAPEQGLGDAGDERSDLYSLGVILFQLVTGALPYEAETPLAIILKHLNEPVPSARAVSPDVPEAVDLIIRKLMAKEPDDRYQTANALIADLEKIERALENDPLGEHIDEHETLIFAQPSPSSTGEIAAAVSSTAEFPVAAGGAGERGGGGIGRWLPWLLLLVVLIGGGGLIAAQAPGGIPMLLGLVTSTPTPSPTPESTATPTETPMLPPTSTETPSSTDTPMPTLTETPSATPTDTPTDTPIPSATLTDTPTLTPTPLPSDTATEAPSITPSPTITNTPSLTPSLTPSRTPTSTYTPTPTSSATRLPTDTLTPSATYTPSTTLTPSTTPSPTLDVTQTLIQATLLSEFQTATAAVCDFDYEIVKQDPPDADYVQAGEQFTRDITLRNTGTCAWERLTALNYVSGESFNIGARIVIRERVEVGEQIVVAITGQAPRSNGLQSGLWELRTPGQLLIGQPIYITINVYGA